MEVTHLAFIFNDNFSFSWAGHFFLPLPKGNSQGMALKETPYVVTNDRQQVEQKHIEQPPID